MAKQEAKTAVGKVVRRLRRQALSTPEGELVGSEDDLVAKYKVSRPTLRQAAALLSQEQLLRIRRGVGGGYFSSRPTTRAVAHMAAVYLQTRKTKMDEILRAIEPINVEMATLASKNRDPKMLREWSDFHARDRELSAGNDFRDFLRSQVEFMKLLGAAAENRVLELFILTLYDFCGSIMPDEDVLYGHPERVRETWLRRIDLVKAIIDGDTDQVRLTAQRGARMFAKWMSEHHEARTNGGGKQPEIWEFPTLRS